MVYPTRRAARAHLMLWIRDFKFLDGNPDRRVGVWCLELDRGTSFDTGNPPAREGTRLGHAPNIGAGPRSMASRNKDPGAPPGSQSVSSSRWVLNSVASHSIGVPVGGKAAVDQHRARATIIGSDAVMSLVRSDHARGNGNDEGEGDQSVRKHFQPPIRKIVPKLSTK